MKLLLAVDGSADAETAIGLLAELPFREPPDVLVVHVCPVPDLHSLGSEVQPEINRIVDECRAKGEQLVAETAPRCQSWARSVDRRVLTGQAAREIVSAAEKERAELIVVGRRGISGARRFLLGGVSEKVASHAPCSVLVVHPTAAGRSPKLRHVLIADDASLIASNAVARFASLPLGNQRQVTVLGVLEVIRHFGLEYSLGAGQTWPLEADLLQRHLQRSVELLRSATPNVTFKYHQVPHAADDILSTAEHLPADLIVVGSAGKSGWERLLLGSVSAQVLRHAPCSVWIERELVEHVDEVR